MEVEKHIKKKKRIKKRYTTETRVKTQQSAVRLQELGPRMTLSLIKIQEGFCDGQVLYHQYGTPTTLLLQCSKLCMQQDYLLRCIHDVLMIVTKTPEEEAKLEEKKERERELKEQRRKQQLLNLAKKGKLPPGVEAPEAEEQVKEEGASGRDNEEEEDDEDEKIGQDGDEDDRDYGSEGEEDAEVETLPSRKKRTGKSRPTKKRK
ncbi:MAG: hypothetical protein ACYCT1_20570, partial [Steroidobacteraceae bacterium]